MTLLVFSCVAARHLWGPNLGLSFLKKCSDPLLKIFGFRVWGLGLLGDLMNLGS